MMLGHMFQGETTCFCATRERANCRRALIFAKTFHSHALANTAKLQSKSLSPTCIMGTITEQP